MNAEMTDDSDIVFVKYSRYATAPKHNIWRLKDEQFRVNGREKLGGWMWVSSTLTRQFLARPERPSLGIRADTTSVSIVFYTNGNVELVSRNLLKNERKMKFGIFIEFKNFYSLEFSRFRLKI